MKPINAFLDADEIMNAAQQHWRWIWQQINYVPIFQLAENVIECIPLTQPELKKLAKVYDTLKNKELQAIAKLDQDKVRQAIDDAFSEVLNLPNLSTLRELLARESGLTGKGLYVPVSYPPTQKKSKIAK